MASDAVHDPELLAQIHKLLLKMLGDFDAACRQLGIPYSVYGGTMIGAIRHQGFIPWDDDVDVLMTREDYERFLREAPAVMGSSYRFDNTRSLPEYPYMFTKLGLVDTLLIPEFARNAKYRMPVSMDLLPLDTVPKDPAAFRSQSRATWLWGRLLFLTGTPTPMLINTHGPKRWAIYTATSLAYWGMRLARVTPRRLQKLWERAATRHNQEPTGRFTDFSMRDPENWAVDLEEIQPPLDMPFENITVQVAPAYDAMMRRTYGDYMELPPLEQRRNHKPVEVQLGPYLDPQPEA
ncbi:LPS biosynthesis protein [Actinomyces bovis]|uniref:LPS biosynthesis protein n=1 Tax=Actinomyces bovis TaxID=1658 RepID=A0ABY1VMH4_9ACTO|nr:LicD family protein [Actinomyces bovis]SPT53309.1 LPS biosynthesis protein [Actinomyces bovis]VEG52635.1 LPS biosynthesis protein [Actinomyces israelii]